MMKIKSVIVRFLIISLFFAATASHINVKNFNLQGEEIKKQSEDSSKKMTDDQGIVYEKKNKSTEETSTDSKIAIKGNSLFSTVKQGGPLMIFLILLGLAAMTIVMERSIFFTQNSVWKGQFIEGILKEKASGSKALFREDMEDDLKAYFGLYNTRLERGMALLSGIGNLAPIAGFLGTVIGMISAFASIAAATTVNAKVVAVGIQTALITTAGGLIVAAPTLAAFFLYTHIIQSRNAQAEEIIAELTEPLPRLSTQLNAEIN